MGSVPSIVDLELKCSGCGYDLRGLPEARCPECGLSFDRDFGGDWNKQELRWFFEDRPALWSFVGTALMVWWPGGFWRRVGERRPVRRRRVVAFSIISLVVPMVLGVLMWGVGSMVDEWASVPSLTSSHARPWYGVWKYGFKPDSHDLLTAEYWARVWTRFRAIHEGFPGLNWSESVLGALAVASAAVAVVWAGTRSVDQVLGCWAYAVDVSIALWLLLLWTVWAQIQCVRGYDEMANWHSLGGRTSEWRGIVETFSVLMLIRLVVAMGFQRTMDQRRRRLFWVAFAVMCVVVLRFAASLW